MRNTLTEYSPSASFILCAYLTFLTPQNVLVFSSLRHRGFAAPPIFVLQNLFHGDVFDHLIEAILDGHSLTWATGSDSPFITR